MSKKKRRAALITQEKISYTDRWGDVQWEYPVGSPGGRSHSAVPRYQPARGTTPAIGAGYNGGPNNGQGGSGFNGSNR